MIRVVLLMLQLAAAPPEQTDAGNALAQGLRLYEALDYRRAAIHLRRAVSDEGLPMPERIEALAYLARVLAILDRPRPARGHFVQVLLLRPDYQLSWEESPRIREAFADAQAIVKKRLAAGARSAGDPAAFFAPGLAGLDPPRSVDEPEPERTFGSRRILVIAGCLTGVAAIVAAVLLTQPDGNPTPQGQHLGRWRLP